MSGIQSGAPNVVSITALMNRFISQRVFTKVATLCQEYINYIDKQTTLGRPLKDIYIESDMLYIILCKDDVMKCGLSVGQLIAVVNLLSKHKFTDHGVLKEC